MGQFEPETGSIMFQLGYANMEPKNVDVNLDGFTANFSYEYLNSSSHLAYGASLSYIEGTGATDTASYRYHTWPIAFQLKGYIGKDKTRGYIQGLAGVQTTSSQTDGGNVQRQTWESGIVAGLGAGLNLLIGTKHFLNIGYTAYWMDTRIYERQLLHTVVIGLGIQQKRDN